MNVPRTIEIPGYYEIQKQPQRAHLIALDLSITLAEHALRNAHTKAGYSPFPGDEPPVELARVIMARCAELRGLIPAYMAVVDSYKVPPKDPDDTPY
jgi:hypothetical protein